MIQLIFAAIILVPMSAFAITGVNVEANNDTVLKIKYIGSDPNNTTHPAATIHNKAFGLEVNSNSVSSAKAVIGRINGFALPYSGTAKVGVIGAGDYGVIGKGAYGVQGEGSNFGVIGIGDVRGVFGTSTTSGGTGIWGTASGSASRGVFGQATTGVFGSSTVLSGIGVHGEATNGGIGVKGIGHQYGMYATIANGGYWPIGLRAETGSPTQGTGVQTSGGVGVYSYGFYSGVEAYGGQYGNGIYADGGEYSAYFEGDTYAGGTYEGSDISLKQNVRSIGYGLSAVMAFQPKAYEMKAGERQNRQPGTRIGLIAQDVQAVVPEAVKKVKTPIRRNKETGEPIVNAERSEFLAISYTSLVPILIKAIQEQQAEIEAMKAELNRLTPK